METFPKLGMKTEQVRSRLKKYDSVKAENLKGSLLQQVELCEGEKAAFEIVKEFSNNCNTNRIGYSPMYSQNYEKIFRGSA